MPIPTESAAVLAPPSAVRLELASSEQQTRTCVFTSDELLQGRREAWIEHRGEMYRLRLTGSGKLYLTK
jgi:hemin uptake protein HemP